MKSQHETLLCDALAFLGAHLQTLALQRSRWRLRACETIQFDNDAASTLRGALGALLRGACCFTGAPSCEGCALRSACVYGTVFDCIAPPGMTSHNADVPRPFVLAPRTNPRMLRAGDLWEFDLSLLGRAINSLPLCLWSLAQLEELGLGAQREQGCGRFGIEEVIIAPDPNAAIAPHQIFARQHAHGPEAAGFYAAPPLAASRALWDAARRPPNGDLLVLRWETPLCVLRDGKPLQSLSSFGDLLRPLLRRVTALWQCHAPHPPGPLPDLAAACRTIIAAADTVSCDATALRWTTHARYSARQKREVPFGGLTGDLVLDGDWRAFWPLLQAGENVHVGKNCVMGQGRYRILSP